MPPPIEHLRLSAGPGFHLPGLAAVAEGVAAGTETESRLESVHFDTPDLRLARWGVSLRHVQGEDWILTLGSGEHRFPGTAKRPPAAAADLVSGYVRALALAPVARLSTWRRQVWLEGPAAEPLARVVDDEVSVLSGRRVAARFREVEITLQPGAEWLREALLDRLRGAGASTADPTPNHLLAMGPGASAAPEVHAADLGPHATAADAVRRALAGSVARLLAHDPGLRQGGDPTDVHKARVATRRLRSHLRTFRSLLDRGWAADLRDELGWLAAELGAVRDAEVLLARLTGRAADLPEADRRAVGAISAGLRAEVEAGRVRLGRTIRSERYLRLLDRLVMATREPAVTEAAADPAASVLPALARAAWKPLRAGVRRLGPDSPDADLHGVRIQAKRARYAAEAAVPVAGAGAALYAQAAAGLQTVLGEHQDSVTARDWLRRHAGSGRRAFAAGQLAALETVAADRARDEWPAAWKALDRRRLRAWWS